MSKALNKPRTNELFGNECCERRNGSLLSLTVLNDAGAIVGFACFDDCPRSITDKNMTRVNWPNWCSEHLPHRSLLSGSTIWLRFFSATMVHELDIAEQAMQMAFSSMSDVEQIAYALPVGISSFAPLHEMFEEAIHESEESSWRIFSMQRPITKVRVARIEDHDDLVPIFEEQSEMLQDNFGEFFLAEHIEAQDENNRAFVLEMDGRARGLLSVTTEVSADVLSEFFDLSMYNYFHRSKVHSKSSPLPSQYID